MSFNALEWLNENMHRNYPLHDECTVVGDAGEYLPSSFLVDMSIVVPPLPDTEASSRFYVSAINRSDTALQVVLSYHPEEGADFICAIAHGISIALTAGDEISVRTFVLQPVPTVPESHNQLLSMTGSLIVGSCMDMEYSGSFVFSYANATVISTRVLQTAVLRGVTVITEAGTEILLENDFAIKAGPGIVLDVVDEYEESTDTTEQVLVISRTPLPGDAGITDTAALVSKLYQDIGYPIRTINGVPASATGNFDIIGDDCMSVTQGPSSLLLSNPCSRPCCDDVSMADTEIAVQQLRDVGARLMQYYESMSTVINTVQARLSSLLASRR